MRTMLHLALVLGLGACASVGPQAMRRSGPQYNAAVRDVVSEELLLNIVRTRYLDPIQFMAVGTVSAQFSVEVAGGFEGGLSENEPQALGTGGAGFRDAPTLTFTPRQDSAFTKLLTQPLPVETFTAMSIGDKGWRWAATLAALSINGATNEMLGGQPELFDRRVGLLDRLYAEHHISFGHTLDSRPASEPMPRAALDPTDLILAAEQGYRFESVGDDQVQLMALKQRPALRLQSETMDRIGPQLEALGLEPGHAVYPIRAPLELGQDTRASDTLFIGTRSFLAILRIMAGGVDVPCEHQRACLAPNVVLMGIPKNVREVFHVRVCKERPEAQLATFHRGHWFYVDDHDEHSRLAFWMFTLFYDLQLGVESGQRASPVLTLPVG